MSITKRSTKFVYVSVNVPPLKGVCTAPFLLQRYLTCLQWQQQIRWESGSLGFQMYPVRFSYELRVLKNILRLAIWVRATRWFIRVENSKARKLKMNVRARTSKRKRMCKWPRNWTRSTFKPKEHVKMGASPDPHAHPACPTCMWRLGFP